MALKGAVQLQSRLKALTITPEAISKAWCDESIRLARLRVRVGATGRTQRSIRVVNRTSKGARFVADFGAIYLEKGTPPHFEPGGKKGHGLKGSAMKFTSEGRTIFSRKVNHPRTGKHPFMVVSARAALRGLKKEIGRLWDAAG